MQKIFIRLIVVTGVLVMLLMLPFWFQTDREQVLSTVGDYAEQCFYSHGEFQDYTDFGVYLCPAAEMNENPIFSPVSETDIDTIGAFLDNFEEWVAVFRNNDPEDTLVRNYAFDRSIIDESDYFYIAENKDYPKFGCYDVWLFDTQTDTLYYFHNNI